MPIITTYPFKNDPLANKDEIIISDSQSDDPNFKTKTTDLDVLMKYVKSKIQTIEPVSLDVDFKIQLTGLNGFGSAGQVIAGRSPEPSRCTICSSPRIRALADVPMGENAQRRGRQVSVFLYPK